MTPGKFSMYVCGPTVYDLAHLGHGRYALVFDVLRRYLEWRGLSVRHVSNITDVDDKILDRARVENRSPTEVAKQFEEKWFSTMDRLDVLKPHIIPHATDYVDDMIALIESLFECGAAYLGDDGVYFDCSKVSDYGSLARQSLESLRAGARIEAREFKRSPIDFALWKFSDGSWAWDSPWGRGRPGWHTECVAMSIDLLGEEFDLHGGGLDLSFPHHENERAQASALGYGFSRHWIHNGFVMVGSDKMSKSLGNYTTLDDLLESTDPRAYRLLVLQSHYRSPLEVNPRTIGEASRALIRLDGTYQRSIEMGINIDSAQLLSDEMKEFEHAMDNDLDTPGVTARLFEMRTNINQLLDKGNISAAAQMCATMVHIFGVLGIVLGAPVNETIPSEIIELLEARLAARRVRDFVRSDQIRDQILGLGFVVEDTSAGQKVKKV